MLINVKVFPGAKKDSIIRKSENAFDVHTRAEPLMGKANRAAVEIIYRHLGISAREIRIIKGFKTRNELPRPRRGGVSPAGQVLSAASSPSS